MQDDFNIQFSLKNLLEDIEETSVSSGVGAYQARTGMSGKDTYKKHKGERTSGGMVYKDLWETEEGQRVKISPRVQMGGQTGTVEEVRGGFVVVKMDSDGGRYSFHSSDVEPFEGRAVRLGRGGREEDHEGDEEEDLEETFTRQDYDKAQQLLKRLKDSNPKVYSAIQKIFLPASIDPYDRTTYDDLESMVNKLSLAESYSRFKNETKTRSKADQYHQAIREVKKRVEEIHKVFEYVNRLKEELNEDGDGLKYKKHTEAAVSKIREMVGRLNEKLTGLTNETDLTGVTYRSGPELRMQQLNLDTFIKKIINDKKAKDFNHFMAIVNKVLSRQTLTPETSKFIKDFAEKEYFKKNPRVQIKKKNPQGQIEEGEDHMKKYEETKENPESLIGYKFADLDQGMTDSGRGTVTVWYKVVSYLKEQGGVHYYSCKKLDKSGKEDPISAPKTFSLEQILAIY